MNRVSILILFSIMIMACDKEPNLNSSSESTPTLALISPISQNNVNHENVLLRWDTNTTGPYDLIIAIDSNYSFILIDTTASTNQISLPLLPPNTKCYWKIVSGDLEASSYFVTHDLLNNISDFNGDALVREYYDIPMGGIGLDTTYFEFIEFSFSDNDLTIDSEYGSFSHTYELKRVNIGGENGIRYYFNEGGGGSNFRTMEYFYEIDSIHIRRHSGGNAGGARWVTSINK